MIKNERQYRITSAQADRFEKAISDHGSTPPKDNNIHSVFWQAERDAMIAQLAELRADIAAYEALQTGRRRSFTLREFGDLPRALIEARIAAGLTHRDLASRLDLPEQAIQRYEATEYTSASLERLHEVADAIGIELSGIIELPQSEPTKKQLFHKLKGIGLDRRFVLERLLKPSVATALSSSGKTKEAVSGALLQAATTIQRIFKIEPTLLFSAHPLGLDPAIVGETRFKRAKRASTRTLERSAQGYVVFAHYLALLALQASAHIPRRKVPETWMGWRSEILGKFGSITFETVLQFLWSVGIPVLPLRDQGAFHGACWRTGGRDVVVLKQRSSSEDRWLYDALHESGHIVDEGESESFGIVEEVVPSPDDPAEERAANFAANIILDGQADELAEKAVELANGNIRFLETAARRVAQDANVSLGGLANHLAFRIAQDTTDETEQINWWGTAARLQKQTKDPWRMARDALLQHVDLSVLNELDREILVRGLRE